MIRFAFKRAYPFPTPAASGTLRAVLLKTVMSWHGALKQTTSEFIYTLCEDQTDEYLRLCGFGAGVGLLGSLERGDKKGPWVRFPTSLYHDTIV
jgi:hypothetical protein